MTCSAVRERLPEHALGSLSSREVPVVEAHLMWCAACRKEAGALERAAATFGFALAPAPPPDDLGDRVTDAVRRAAGRRRPGARRGPRMAVASIVAAMFAVASLGWGAVMAGRAARYSDQVAAVQRQQETSIESFANRVLARQLFQDPRNRVFIGTLGPETGGSSAGGAAATLVSPSGNDLAILMVSGLVPSPAHPLPYRAVLTGARGTWVLVGTIDRLDSGGGATAARSVPRDLSGFTHIEVRDRSGTALLSGILDERPPASPSP